MFEINGKYTSAKFIIDNVEYACIQQIRHLCDLDVLQDSKIRIMADVCPAIGTTIGSTFTYDKYILPSLVSGDIGCGIISTKIKVKKQFLNGDNINKIIRENLLGKEKIQSILQKYQNKVDLNQLYCRKYINVDRCYSQLSELGGGNHFIEFDKDSNNDIWLTVHSGSRLLGQQIYDYYIEQGDQHNTRIFSTLSDNLAQEYIHDAEIAQQFAAINRYVIIDVLCKFLKADIIEEYHSIHNYIDSKNKIIRKGAISAQQNEKVVIPISASPIYGGVIIGKGKGNDEWNYSAPHGAGRICSRSESKDLFSLTDFKKSMDGVYSKNIDKNGISEAPLVYKKREVIQESLKNLVDIEDILIPFFNFKN